MRPDDDQWQGQAQASIDLRPGLGKDRIKLLIAYRKQARYKPRFRESVTRHVKGVVAREMEKSIAEVNAKEAAQRQVWASYFCGDRALCMIFLATFFCLWGWYNGCKSRGLI